ncbi:MAG: DnaJ domain-containing protein [Deltaproteobacteria bacterium]
MSAPSATGNLTSTPFCELLVYALSQALSGSLVLECPDRSKHAILFAAGTPAKARVANAGTRLGQVLLQLGGVDEDALRLALEADTEELLGQRLFARGALDPDALASGLSEQLLRQLSWLSGAPPATAFAYYAGVDLLEDWGGAPVRIDPLAAIWRAIDAHAPKDRLAAAIEGLADKTLRLHHDSRVARFDFHVRIRGLLDVLKVKPQNRLALEATRLLDLASLHKLLYALVLTRHLDTGMAPLGVLPGSRVEITPRPGSSAGRFAVRPPQSQRGSALRPAQSTAGQKAVVAPPSVAQGPVSARAAPATQRAVAQPAAPRQPAARAAPPAAVAPATRERAPLDALQTGRFLSREEIESKLANVDQVTHYDLLDLPGDATPEHIGQAFPALARRWHPDRLSPELADLRDGVTRVFARMTEASRVLGNPGARKAYDETLGTPDAAQQEQEQIGIVLRSAEAFQKAEILLKKRDLEGAELLARTAHEGDPDQPEYAALYAWIRSRRADATEEDIASSLAMLRKAISKQTDNVKIHYYLACLLKAAGQAGAAMREYRHVAEHDPSNVDAAREIRLHDMRRAHSKPPTEPGVFGKIFKR